VRAIDLGVIAGDGIGPEVTEAALRVLQTALDGEAELRPTRYPYGADHFLRTGTLLDDDQLDALARHDALLLGAVGGDPRDDRLADGVIERGLLLKIRFAFDHYVNLRPAVLRPGSESPLAEPGEIDFVVVREGTEGPYSGNGGIVRRDTPHEIATEVSVNTAYGVERVLRVAFALAASRRGRLTLIHKSNVIVHAGSLWQRVAVRVGREFPSVEVDYLHVDAAAIFFVTAPSRFDVVVTDNLFGDIVTDLAGAVAGGIGLAASANIDPERRFPSMFEPVHGSAPDIAGKGVADPTAAILSAAMMLQHLGMHAAAGRIEAAVRGDLRERPRARRPTREIEDSISRRLVRDREPERDR